jgi:DNA-binding CsgD family transcriptional regulator
VAAPTRDLEWYGGSPRAAVEALGLIGLPAAVLGERGKPLAANALFAELVRGVVCDLGERLAFTDGPTDALFAEALLRLRSVEGGDTVCAIPIRARGDRPPMVVHLVPAHAATTGVLPGECTILVVTRVTPPAAPAAEVLQGLFDLTPAEARVARGIGEGRTIEAIAEGFGLSRETVRSQLKAVLGKMGLGRQADLVGMLAGVDILPQYRTL